MVAAAREAERKRERERKASEKLKKFGRVKFVWGKEKESFEC